MSGPEDRPAPAASAAVEEVNGEVRRQSNRLSLAHLVRRLAIYFFARRIRSESTWIRSTKALSCASAGGTELDSDGARFQGAKITRLCNFIDERRQSCKRTFGLTLTNVNSALVISTLMVIGTAAMYYVGTLHVLTGALPGMLWTHIGR